MTVNKCISKDSASESQAQISYHGYQMSKWLQLHDVCVCLCFCYLLVTKHRSQNVRDRDNTQRAN